MSIDQKLTYNGRSVLLDIISADGKPRRLPNIWITGGAQGTNEPDGASFIADISVLCELNDRYGIVEFDNPLTRALEKHTVTSDEPFQLDIKIGEREIPGTLKWTHVPELGTTTRSRR